MCPHFSQLLRVWPLLHMTKLFIVFVVVWYPHFHRHFGIFYLPFFYKYKFLKFWFYVLELWDFLERMGGPILTIPSMFMKLKWFFFFCANFSYTSINFQIHFLELWNFIIVYLSIVSIGAYCRAWIWGTV